MTRVLLDCDGVLADFVGGFLAIVNRACGTFYTHEHVTEYDVCKALGITTEQATHAFDTVSGSRGFALALEPLPGAIDGVRRLQEIADVFIVTSPWNSSPTWTHEREAWLRRHFDIPHRRVIHTGAKYMVRGDFLVDDKTETLTRWDMEHGPHRKAIQWQTPHNRRDGWAGPSTNSWTILADMIARRR